MKKFLKYLKFSIFCWCWVLGTICVCSFVFISLIHLSFTLAVCVTIMLLTYGIINSINCILAFKKHLQEYEKLRSIFLEHPNNIKKSMLYLMQHYYCTNLLVKDLCKEFNIQLN